MFTPSSNTPSVTPQRSPALLANSICSFDDGTPSARELRLAAAKPEVYLQVTYTPDATFGAKRLVPSVIENVTVVRRDVCDVTPEAFDLLPANIGIDFSGATPQSTSLANHEQLARVTQAHDAVYHSTRRHDYEALSRRELRPADWDQRTAIINVQEPVQQVAPKRERGALVPGMQSAAARLEEDEAAARRLIPSYRDIRRTMSTRLQAMSNEAEEAQRAAIERLHEFERELHTQAAQGALPLRQRRRSRTIAGVVASANQAVESRLVPLPGITACRRALQPDNTAAALLERLEELETSARIVVERAAAALVRGPVREMFRCFNAEVVAYGAAQAEHFQRYRRRVDIRVSAVLAEDDEETLGRQHSRRSPSQGSSVRLVRSLHVSGLAERRLTAVSEIAKAVERMGTQVPKGSRGKIHRRGRGAVSLFTPAAKNTLAPTTFGSPTFGSPTTASLIGTGSKPSDTSLQPVAEPALSRSRSPQQQAFIAFGDTDDDIQTPRESVSLGLPPELESEGTTSSDDDSWQSRTHSKSHSRSMSPGVGICVTPPSVAHLKSGIPSRSESFIGFKAFSVSDENVVTSLTAHDSMHSSSRAKRDARNKRRKERALCEQSVLQAFIKAMKLIASQQESREFAFV